MRIARKKYSRRIGVGKNKPWGKLLWVRRIAWTIPCFSFGARRGTGEGGRIKKQKEVIAFQRTEKGKDLYDFIQLIEKVSKKKRKGTLIEGTIYLKNIEMEKKWGESGFAMITRIFGNQAPPTKKPEMVIGDEKIWKTPKKQKAKK